VRSMTEATKCSYATFSHAVWRDIEHPNFIPHNDMNNYHHRVLRRRGRCSHAHRCIQGLGVWIDYEIREGQQGVTTEYS